MSSCILFNFQNQHQQHQQINKRSSNNSFFDADDTEELHMVGNGRPAVVGEGKRNKPGGGGYLKQYMESSNKRQQVVVANNSHSFPEPERRSESPMVDVWNYDETEHRRPVQVKPRQSQTLAKQSQLSVPKDADEQPLNRSRPGPLVAPRQVANSVALELSVGAALDEPPKDISKHRGSASQRRAQRIFERLESEDSGVHTGSQKSSGKNSAIYDASDDTSPKMPQRKVPALEKAFFIDFGDESKPLKPPPKFVKPKKAAMSPPMNDNDSTMFDNNEHNRQRKGKI